jgi:hypothetical protein
VGDEDRGVLTEEGTRDSAMFRWNSGLKIKSNNNVGVTKKYAKFE